jgi:hypothetical protein
MPPGEFEPIAKTPSLPILGTGYSRWPTDSFAASARGEDRVDEHRGMASSPQAAEAFDTSPIFIPAGSYRARLKRLTSWPQ